ncbi:MAG: glycosyltransferase [Puniceicoccales bacterium]|jgi:glycosyltransferase involved in cell wall biosynthesis|nr:glycosyltransferase [Puniceicoccales bacterium]
MELGNVFSSLKILEARRLGGNPVSPFLSVVIPAYNAGETIGRCVRSLYEAMGDMSNEVVVVDDGSPDNTAAAVEKLMKKFPTLRLIRQPKNMGAGAARNRGLAEVSGEFVWFVDGDDEVLANGFREFDAKKACVGQDVLMFRYARTMKGCRSTLPWLKYDNDVMASRPGDVFTADQFSSVLATTNAVWNKWFRRESIIATGVKFPDCRSGEEDLGFVVANLCAAGSIRFVDRALYVYHEEASQLSRMADERRIDLRAFDGCEEWMRRRKVSKNCKIGYLVCKIHHLLLVHNSTVGIARERARDNLEDCLQAVGGRMLRALLNHPFLRSDVKQRLVELRSGGGSIIGKLFALSDRAVKCFTIRPRTRHHILRPSLSWALLYAIFSVFYLPSIPLCGDDVNLYISGGGGGGATGSSNGGAGGSGGSHAGSGGTGSDSGSGGGGGGAYVGDGTGAAANGSGGGSEGGGGDAFTSLPTSLLDKGIPTANDGSVGYDGDNGGSGGSGGPGGDASYNVAIEETDGIDNIYIRGGAGGKSSMGSYRYFYAGGAGGDAELDADGGDVAVLHNLELTGGNGGDNYYNAGGSGGAGGYAELRAGDITIGDDLALTGGAGGSGSDCSVSIVRDGHDGGAGAYASLEADGVVTVRGNVSLASGTKGTDGADYDIYTGGAGGAGGAVTFKAATLLIENKAAYETEVPDHAVTLTKGDGDLNVAVDNLFVGAGARLALSLDGTAAWSENEGIGTGVKFDSLTFGEGSSFAATTNNGGTHSGFTTYNVVGPDAKHFGELDARGKNFNFFLSADAKDRVMLHVMKATVEGGLPEIDTQPGYENANISGAAIRVGVPDNSSPLQVGDRIVLIRAGADSDFSGIGDSSDEKGMPTLIAPYGSLMECAFDLSVETDETKDLVATLATSPAGASVGASSPVWLQNKAKALSEGNAAALTLVCNTVNAAADGRLFHAARNGGVFSSISGGKSRYDTGSHVDCNEFSALVGLGKTFEVSCGDITSALFLEGGIGRYKSENSFPAGDVSGKGDSWCLGGGIFSRLDGNGSDSGHFYGEWSAHVGKIKHDFSSPDVVNAAGTEAEYSSDGIYFGAHGGGGYVYEISDGVHLDAYAKYIWTRKFGNDVTISTGETVKFKNADSSRLLSGLRLSRSINSTTIAYIGGACDYEFAGKANATVSGMNIDAPSLRGASAVAEIGISADWDNVSADIGVRGYLGKRRGLSAFLALKRTF